MSDLDDYPFSLPQKWVSAWIFWNFSSQIKNGIFETSSFQVFTTINDYSGNDLVLKLVDDFHVSHYASLTRKSSRFVGSITLRNLNQFKKKLVGSSMKCSICLLNLRKYWDGGLTFPLFLLIWHGMTLNLKK